MQFWPTKHLSLWLFWYQHTNFLLSNPHLLCSPSMWFMLRFMSFSPSQSPCSTNALEMRTGLANEGTSFPVTLIVSGMSMWSIPGQWESALRCSLQPLRKSFLSVGIAKLRFTINNPCDLQKILPKDEVTTEQSRSLIWKTRKGQPQINNHIVDIPGSSSFSVIGKPNKFLNSLSWISVTCHQMNSQ